MTAKPKMPFRDAMDLVPDDMPDGAYWAMAHDIAGLDYGDGFDELYDEGKTVKCDWCSKRFGSEQARNQHARAKHPKAALARARGEAP